MAAEHPSRRSTNHQHLVLELFGVLEDILVAVVVAFLWPQAAPRTAQHATVAGEGVEAAALAVEGALVGVAVHHQTYRPIECKPLLCHDI